MSDTALILRGLAETFRQLAEAHQQTARRQDAIGIWASGMVDAYNVAKMTVMNVLDELEMQQMDSV